MDARAKTAARAHGTGGFSALEIVIVLAVIALLAAIAYPRLTATSSRQQTRSAITAVAGVMQRARENAVEKGTPHLVTFRPPSGGGSPGCPMGSGPPIIEIVADTDGSYTKTPADAVLQVPIEALADCKVKPLGPGTLSALLSNLDLPEQDVGAVAAAACGGPITCTAANVVATVTNGSTLPLDAFGIPMVAFSPGGWAVDPATPGIAGSGAGAIYLTDGEAAVYVVIVKPLGRVVVRGFDIESGTWK